MPHIITNDGIRLSYEEKGEGCPLVMIHGWTFSGRFFGRNVPVLARHARVVTPDLRGHGRSDKPDHGYRMSRLAADLRDLLQALDLRDATLLGWSLGAPVIWSYLELFGLERVRSAIFVQQTPRQFFAPDWKLGHASCYDQASLATLQATMAADPAGFDEQNLSDCLHNPLPDAEKHDLLAEMALSPMFARSALMADHTVHDWRDLIPHLDLPTLVMVACKDKVFAPEGPAWVGEHAPLSRTVFFDDSSHMLFLDEADKFNAAVRDLLSRGPSNVVASSSAPIDQSTRTNL